MFRKYLVSSFILVSALLYCQESRVDSLINVAVSSKTLLKTTTTINRDSLINTLDMSNYADKRLDIVYSIINNGVDVSTFGLSYHYKLLNWAKKHDDAVMEAVISAEIGYNITMNGSRKEGIKLILDALKQAKQTGNNRAIGIAYENLGVSFEGDKTINLGYLKSALKYSRAGDDKLYVFWALLNLGDINSELNNQKEAKLYCIKALEWAVANNLNSMFPIGLVGLSRIETVDANKFHYLQSSLQMLIKNKDLTNISRVSADLGELYLFRNQRDSAMYYARKSLISSHSSALVRQLPAVNLLRKVFRGQNADSTLKYTEIYYSLKDSLDNNADIQRAKDEVFLNERKQQQVFATEQRLKTNMRFTVLITAIGFLLLLAFVFWRNNRKSKKANSLLQSQKEEIQITLQELKSTQTQLIQSEKMASLGELTAGIAHEIQNPLNFVNNFSEVSSELLDEMNTELDKGDIEEAKAIAIDVKQNLEKINHHGKRADAIVKGMLQHSRSSTGKKELTDLNALCDEYLRLSYHGLRAKDKSFNATMNTNFDENIGKIEIIPQDFGRVILNLLTNAFYACTERSRNATNEKNNQLNLDAYEPTVSISTKKENDKIIITVTDNGNGMPKEIMDKVFQPFFTTKPTGQGTGLGLSMSYDIITKGHGGELKVSSIPNEGLPAGQAGSTFTIVLNN